MLCGICKKNQATVHLTEIVDGKVVEMHICAHCAQDKTQELKEQFNAPNVFGTFLTGITPKEKVLLCPVCGLHYRDFRKKGRFGCGNCYIVFQEQIVPLLRNIHGSNRYMGKFPAGLDNKPTKEKQLKALRIALARAIEIEAYEDAARLRDEINKIEG